MTNNNLKPVIPLLVALSLLFTLLSCATGIGLYDYSDNSIPTDSDTAMLPEIPEVPELIMGEGLMEAQILADYLLKINADVEEDFIFSLAQYYICESAVEGVNHDVAFAQMCLETGFLKYGNLVTAEMNNFCGLGAIGPEEPGLSFPDVLTGVQAHIQHLKAYASTEPLTQELVDPRYRYLNPGSSPKIDGLSGTWAADKQYAEKIKRILEMLYQFSVKMD